MNTYSVLVVDDEECIRDLCKDILPMWGYNIDTASDGFKGIEKAKTGKYQVVLTDIKMPSCDGITVLEKVKAFDSQIEVIVMTGYGTIETAVDAMKKGAYDFVMKPLSINQMQAVLKKCVEKIRLFNQNKELTEVNFKLRQLNEMKEKFIAITSHELRTPICSIGGFIELLKYTLDGKMDDDPVKLIDEMETILHSLVNIVSNMHDLAAIDIGGFKLKREAFNLLESISRVKIEFLPIVRDRNLEIDIVSPEVELYYNGDKRRICQVVRELLQNAVKFTPDGGKITLSLTNELIDKKIKISVRDTGIGIPPDKIQQVFERFYEVQDSMFHSSSDVSFMGGGLGVGLSLVKEIIHNHGGDISVESNVGEGSTFTIFLPY